MSNTMVIDERFCGFPHVAIGGYVGGVLAKAIGSSAEVRFLKPVMIGRQLSLEQPDPGCVELRDADNTLAEATATKLDIEAPAALSLAEAQAASGSYPGFERHPFPRCFCCGPSRAEGDGLRIFPGPIPERNLVAAAWTPHASVADADGTLGMEAVWSAVDCPAIWALIDTTPADSADRVVTGTLTVEVVKPLRSGEQYIVLGWPLGGNGHKLFAGAAVMSSRGDLHVLAKQTCVITDRGIPLSISVWPTLNA